MKIILLCKGGSLTKVSKDFILGHDEIAWSNIHNHVKFNYLIPNKVDYLFLREKSFFDELNADQKEAFNSLDIKHVITTGIRSKNVKSISKFNVERHISPVGSAYPNNFNASTGLIAFIYLISLSPKVLTVVGLDLFIQKQELYYFNIDDNLTTKKNTDGLKTILDGEGKIKEGVDIHLPDVSLNILKQKIEENKHIKFRICTTNEKLKREISDLENVEIIKENEISVIIPLKKKSIRVPNKNFKEFGDTTLIELKLKNLIKVDTIDNIIINTESQELIDELSEKYKEHTKIKYVLREPYYATPECSGSEFFENIAKNAVGDVLIYSPVTSPFVTPEILTEAIKFYSKNNDKFDSVVSVHDMKHHMWMDGKPLNYNPYNAPNSQDLPTIYKITYGFGILSKELMVERRNITGYKPYFYEVDEIEATDIDTNLEFDFAEFLYKKNMI